MHDSGSGTHGQGTPWPHAALVAAGLDRLVADVSALASTAGARS
jgi:hypothetical protein